MLLGDLLEHVSDIPEEKGKDFDGAIESKRLTNDLLGQLEDESLFLSCTLGEEVVDDDDEFPVSVH